MKKVQAKAGNPISELISDDLFEVLYSQGIITDIRIRDYHIRKRFQELRANNINAIGAMNAIHKDYQFLHIDTIRKIVYGDIKKKQNLI